METHTHSTRTNLSITHWYSETSYIVFDAKMSIREKTWKRSVGEEGPVGKQES